MIFQSLTLLNSLQLKMHSFIICNHSNSFYCPALKSATKKKGENGNWHFGKHQNCAYQYVGVLYKNEGPSARICAP